MSGRVTERHLQLIPNIVIPNKQRNTTPPQAINSWYKSRMDLIQHAETFLQETEFSVIQFFLLQSSLELSLLEVTYTVLCLSFNWPVIFSPELLIVCTDDSTRRISCPSQCWKHFDGRSPHIACRLLSTLYSHPIGTVNHCAWVKAQKHFFVSKKSAAVNMCNQFNPPKNMTLFHKSW